ncbi:unnamed protein product [Protopolystoma xenopodis]|uniref:Uncharacterized protein n=1 Tax=Protopolystoma xenopodis TaxID=117903 RepID=A0A448WC65_9PLAT|nr:unnamed protein product [Protopolystoma xenopodis]
MASRMQCILLRVFHLPALGLYDNWRRWLEVKRRVAPNAIMVAESQSVEAVVGMKSVYSEQAEGMAIRLQNVQCGVCKAVHEALFRSNAMSTPVATLIPELGEEEMLKMEDRKVGFRASLTIPDNALAAAYLESARICYYLRVSLLQD